MLERQICQMTGALECQLGSVIQRLWSDYGVIQRVKLDHPFHTSAIVKHVDLSEVRSNRRGWGGGASHHRKVQSYQVETSFYRIFGDRCDLNCRIPELIAAQEKPDQTGWLVVLEDLDAAGFHLRKHHVSADDVEHCLKWLANLHATFMDEQPIELWPVGTYWHLGTRNDEWNAMGPGRLKDAAAKIDEKLNACRFQTFVHGDAKLANFCFSDRQHFPPVAAVDFQYIGGGCGMKDVAYFLSSCLDESESQRQQEPLLDFYFQHLQQSLETHHKNVDFDALQREWRSMYRFAWADFCRFLAGWSPGHWKMNQYNDTLTRQVVDELLEPLS